MTFEIDEFSVEIEVIAEPTIYQNQIVHATPTTQTVDLSAHNLFQELDLLCRFKNSEYQTQATVSSNLVRCPVPTQNSSSFRAEFLDP